MRILQQDAAEYTALHTFRNPPVPPSTAAEAPLSNSCVPRSSCPWWPYSSARDFKTNTALVFIILFSAFLCALAFNAAVRYFLRRRRRRLRSSASHGGDANHDDKAAVGSKTAADDDVGVAVPTVIFSAAAAENGGAMTEECMICLGEFVEGERVRVLENCKHCFHIQCVRQWLNAHSSCPTCRAICH